MRSMLLTLTFVMAASGATAGQPVGAQPDAGALHSDERGKRSGFAKSDLLLKPSQVLLSKVKGELPHGGVAWDQFLGQYEPRPVVFLDRRSGRPTSVIASIPLVPGSGARNTLKHEDIESLLGRPAKQNDPEMVADVFLQFVRRNQAVLRIDPEELGRIRASRIDDELWHVVASRQIDGIPVRYSRLAGNISHGNLILLGTEYWADVSVSTSPKIGGDRARQTSLRYVSEGGGTGGIVDEPQLMIVPFSATWGRKSKLGDGYGHRLAWVMVLEQDGEVGSWEALVDAHSGELLGFESLIQEDEAYVVGGVYPSTNTGVCPTRDYGLVDPTRCGVMQSGYPLALMNLSRGAATVRADRGGGFDPDALPSSQPLRLKRTGTWAEIIEGVDDYGNPYCAGADRPFLESAPALVDGVFDIGGANGDHGCEFPPDGTPGNSAGARTAAYEISRLGDMESRWVMPGICIPATEESLYCFDPSDCGSGAVCLRLHTCVDAVTLEERGLCSAGCQEGEICIEPEPTGFFHATRAVLNEPGQASECAARYDPGDNRLHFTQPLTNINGGEHTCYLSENKSIIAHEWAHWLDMFPRRPVGGGTPSKPREGYADAFAALWTQNSCIGYGKYSCTWVDCTTDPNDPDPLGHEGCGLTDDLTGSNNLDPGGHCLLDCSGNREVDWERMVHGHGESGPDGESFVCGSCQDDESTDAGPCGKNVYCEGLIVGQAVWDLAARELQAAPYYYDTNQAYALALKLFVQGQRGITSWYSCECDNGVFNGCDAGSGYLQFLSADDDNGNLLDGTPHSVAITNAFEAHDMGCPGLITNGPSCAGGPMDAPEVTVANGVSPEAELQLSWSNVPNAEEYLVLRSEGLAGCETGKMLMARVPGTSYTDDEVFPGHQYCYSVMPVGASSSCVGRASTCACTTPFECPGTETSLTLFDEDFDFLPFFFPASWELVNGPNDSVTWTNSNPCSAPLGPPFAGRFAEVNSQCAGGCTS